MLKKNYIFYFRPRHRLHASWAKHRQRWRAAAPPRRPSSRVDPVCCTRTTRVSSFIIYTVIVTLWVAGATRAASRPTEPPSTRRRGTTSSPRVRLARPPVVSGRCPARRWRRCTRMRGGEVAGKLFLFFKLLLETRFKIEAEFKFLFKVLPDCWLRNLSHVYKFFTD